jgi:hypothetical protein
VLSTASYSAPQDSSSILWFAAIKLYIKPTGGDAYAEISGIGIEAVALGDKIDWTVFRVPLLRGGKDAHNLGPVNAGWVGDGKRRDKIFLNREPLVHYIFHELEETGWIGKCPMLSVWACDTKEIRVAQYNYYGSCKVLFLHL